MKPGHWQLAGAMILIGANIPVAKAASPFIPVFIFSFIRYGVSILALWPFIANERGARFGELNRREMLYLGLQALCGGVLYMVLMLYGLRYTSAMSAGIITSTIPVSVAVLAVILLRERFGIRTAIALAFAVTGILAVNMAAARPGAAPWPLLGNGLMAGAVLAESLFIILARRMVAILPPFRMAFAINAIGLVLILPMLWIEARGFAFGSIEPWLWLLPVVYALTSSVLALILWYRALMTVPASQAAIFTSVFPVAAVGASVLVLGEAPQWAHGVALICVLAAIVIGAGEGRTRRDA
jgi:drug/metabolite transporter (DMT)-like permease